MHSKIHPIQLDYINHHQMGFKVQFSTASDYFAAVSGVSKRQDIRFPIYRGDFFPYADNDDSYWTGYYTTRPSLKAISRSVTSLLRSANVFFALSRHLLDFGTSQQLFTKLDTARANAGLFLHHDAITGTARQHVVDDYLNRMNQAIQYSFESISSTISLQITGDSSLAENLRLSYDSLSLEADTVSRVVITNSLLWDREEMICVRTATPYVRVFDSSGQDIPAQVDLDFFKPELASIDSNPASGYLVCILVSVPALGFTTYFFDIRRAQADWDRSLTSLSTIQVFHTDPLGDRKPADHAPFKFTFEEISSTRREPISIANSRYALKISSLGLLDAIKLNSQSEWTQLAHTFREYSTTSSGAYIFRPADDSINISPGPVVIRISKGKLYEFAQVHYGRELLVSYRVINAQSVIGSHIEVSESIVAGKNKEIASRFETSIGRLNNDIFQFSTHNGAEFIKRPLRNSPECPKLASSFFPTIMGARLLSTQSRLTFYSSHSTAGSSPEVGVVEFLVHRNLLQDDGRGLSQPNQDGSRIRVNFFLLFETKEDGIDPLKLRRMLVDLNHPTQFMTGEYISKNIDPEKSIVCESSLKCQSSMLEENSVGDNVHLVTLQVNSGMSDDVHMIFQNLEKKSFKKVDVDDFISFSRSGVSLDALRESTLTGHYGNLFLFLFNLNGGLEFGGIGVEEMDDELKFLSDSTTTLDLALDVVLSSRDVNRNNDNQNSGIFLSVYFLSKISIFR